MRNISALSPKKNKVRKEMTLHLKAPLAAGASRGPQDLAVPVPPQHLMTLQMSTEDEKIKVLHQDAPPQKV